MKSKTLAVLVLMVLISVAFSTVVHAEEIQPQIIPNINISVGGEGEGGVSSSLQILLLVTLLTLAPTLLLVMTGFTRIIICLHFLRSAMGTQQMPPNQVIIGLALFLTFFLMAKPLTQIYDEAFVPLSANEITQEEALNRGMQPLREFMIKQVKTKDIVLFTNITQQSFENKEDVPNSVLIPAFIIGEVSAGFQFGFWIYIPFIIIDMVVASVLMAMGMMMLPPAMISLPFKILLFVMIDGWNYVIDSVMRSFN